MYWSQALSGSGVAFNAVARARRRESHSAMALVITLSLIVLLSAMIVSFYSYATANRKIENSRANQVKVEQLARSAGDYVVQKFMSEISVNSTATTTGSVTIYNPLSATYSVPLRTISSGIPATDTNFFNLIRQSISAADANASADSTGTASQNGRVVGTNRWNFTVLLGGTGFTGSAQLPCWINIHRTQGATNMISTNVIGRFAYNVYNIGNLLDINAAGHPGTVTATDSVGTVAGANLTVLGTSQTVIDTLINSFRNQGAGSYTNRVDALAQKGFMHSIATNSAGTVYMNNFFQSRQDLLRYAQTQQTELVSILPYLTVFSRSVNAPSWGPTKDFNVGYKYKSNADVSTRVNRFLPNVRFMKSGIVTHYDDDGRTSTYSANVGDQLIQRRFSLAKLKWLTHDGNQSPATAAADQA